MRPIRVLFVAEVSPLARDLLREKFRNHRDVEIVDGAGAIEAGEARKLLALQIMGSQVMLLEVPSQQPVLQNPSSEALISAIREVAATLP